MNNKNIFSSDYFIEGSTETKAEIPEKTQDKEGELKFDQDRYQISKPRRIIVTAKIKTE